LSSHHQIVTRDFITLFDSPIPCPLCCKSCLKGEKKQEKIIIQGSSPAGTQASSSKRII
jgi:hypothetical protein